MTIWGRDKYDFAKGLGYSHAMDRGSQVLLARIVATGRVSELLDNSDKSLGIDKFFHSIGLHRDLKREIMSLNNAELRWLQDYCDGFNTYLEKQKLPSLEMALLRMTPEKYKIEDVLLLGKLISFLGLASTQFDAELNFILPSLMKDDGVKLLKAMHPKFFEGLTDEWTNIIRKVKYEPFFPQFIDIFNLGIPTIRNSNNWAIAGKLTQSGMPIYSSDPHLEINRLPSVWYEAVFKQLPQSDDQLEGDIFYAGITLPGCPALIMGRNRHVSFGFTYGFADHIDFYIEKCNANGCLSGSDYVPLQKHSSTILRKGKENVTVTYMSTARTNRQLLLDPTQNKLPSTTAYYLSWANSHNLDGAKGVATLSSAFKLMDSRNLHEFYQHARGYDISLNWIGTDDKGNIGYQQACSCPKRPKPMASLYPVPGWDKSYEWQGLLEKSELNQIHNPSSGYVCSANNKVPSSEPLPLTINLHMGDYRSSRIREMIQEASSRGKISVEDSMAMMLDVKSKQAEAFMAILRPALNSIGLALKRKLRHDVELLKNWNYEYTADSRAALIFSKFYERLNKNVFTKLYDSRKWDDLSTDFQFKLYYTYTDAILLSFPKSLAGILWHHDETQISVFAKALNETLTLDLSDDPEQTYGDVHQLSLSHIFFKNILGSLGKYIGIDVPNTPYMGTAATVNQNNYYHKKIVGEDVAVGASWRFVTDMAELKSYSRIPGGPSGSIFSRFYKNEVAEWLKGTFKVLHEPTRSKKSV